MSRLYVAISKDMVEAAFDGEMDEVQSWLEKGYDLESMDGHKHTAISEAACQVRERIHAAVAHPLCARHGPQGCARVCFAVLGVRFVLVLVIPAHSRGWLTPCTQGHNELVQFLLSAGANPNARNDQGRSPLYRAAFNNHVETVQLLLKVCALHVGGVAVHPGSYRGRKKEKEKRRRNPHGTLCVFRLLPCCVYVVMALAQSGADPKLKDKELQGPFDGTVATPRWFEGRMTRHVACVTTCALCGLV